jgi:hypothetical protein
MDPVLQATFFDPGIHELMDVEIVEFDRIFSHSIIAFSNPTNLKGAST